MAVGLTLSGVLDSTALLGRLPSKAAGSFSSYASYAQDIAEAAGGQMLATLKPVSEEEALKAIAAMGREGINVLLFAAILAPIMAAISAAVLMIRRRRALSQAKL